MPLVAFPLALFTCWCLLGAEKPAPLVAPYYTAASIVNAADNKSGALAPNTIGTIYGTNLAYSTAQLTANSIVGGALPIWLGASETTVIINNTPAALYYASPGQINFLVPPDLLPGPATLYVDVDGSYAVDGLVKLTLGRAAPGLFQLDPQNAIATLPDGSVLTPSSPAKPGDIVLLWATGLGETTPPADGFQIPTAAAPLIAGANLSILLDGTPVDPAAIQYAGVAPGFPGLYQINLKLPVSTGANPEIRLQLDGATSIAKVYLPVMVN
jgi:uncharacterized protein (TIGR03437 family)